MLSCSVPRRPDFGDVTVMDLHSGGEAHFHCHLGYELQGAKTLTCINASKPHWSSREPICSWRLLHSRQTAVRTFPLCPGRTPFPIMLFRKYQRTGRTWRSTA